ncbi:hypothetical protein ERHA55_51870 (plasmid) [Erwinia rhapontici]|nr:hypothetical protein ERHA55_51870 [Erwinia rhapontici]
MTTSPVYRNEKFIPRHFTGSIVENTQFINCDFSGCDLTDTRFLHCSFTIGKVSRVVTSAGQH